MCVSIELTEYVHVLYCKSDNNASSSNLKLLPVVNENKITTMTLNCTAKKLNNRKELNYVLNKFKIRIVNNTENVR